MPQFLTPVDLTKNELRNVVLQNLASDPASPVKGLFHFSTVDNVPRYYNGSTWVSMTPYVLPAATSTTLGGVKAGAASSGITNTAGAIAIDFGSGATQVATGNHTHSILSNGAGIAALSYNGSSVATVAIANSGVSAGTYKSVTVNLQGQVTGGTNPTTISGFGITDAYTKTEIDSMISGLDPKASVRAATTANITLSGTQTIDTISLVVGDRVLVKDQTTKAQNGIYIVSAGVWARSTDADTNAEVTSGMYCFVEDGSVNKSSGWMLKTTNPIVVGTTDLEFVKFFDILGQISVENLKNGSAGTIPYQSAPNTTAMLAAGSTGQFLMSNGATAPQWRTFDLTNIPDSGLKKYVRVATTGPISLSATQTIDGVAVVAEDRVLVKDQSPATSNGIYVVAAGSWLRSTDADTAAKLTGAHVNVQSGTVNGGKTFVTEFKSTDTLGTTNLTWAKIVNDQSPTLVTPNIGVATGTSFNSITGLASVASPMNGTAAVGTSTTVARQDHVHPVDTSRAASSHTHVVSEVSGAVRKYSVLIGDGTTTTFAITHNLNSDDVIPAAMAVATNDYVYPDFKRVDANNMQVIFSVAPTTNQYKIILHG